MSVKFADLFPIPLGKASYPAEWFLEDRDGWIEALKELARQPESNTYNCKTKIAHLGDTAAGAGVTDMPAFARLKDWIHEQCREYLETAFDPEKTITPSPLIVHSWANVQDGASTHLPHMHSNAELAFNFNLKFDPEVHHSTCYWNPRMQVGFMYGAGVWHRGWESPSSRWTAQMVEAETAEGDLLIWPGMLQHGYPAAEPSGVSRITISGNVMQSNYSLNRGGMSIAVAPRENTNYSRMQVAGELGPEFDVLKILESGDTNK